MAISTADSSEEKVSASATNTINDFFLNKKSSDFLSSTF